MKITDVVKENVALEGEVIQMQPRNPLNQNIITQLKSLSQTALGLFWGGSDAPTAMQAGLAQMSQQEQTRLFNRVQAQLKALGYEDSIVEEDMDLLSLHSLAREAWNDSGRPMSQYRGLPDLEYNYETDSLRIIDLIQDDDPGTVYDKTVYEQGMAEDGLNEQASKLLSAQDKDGIITIIVQAPDGTKRSAASSNPNAINKWLMKYGLRLPKNIADLFVGVTEGMAEEIRPTTGQAMGIRNQIAQKMNPGSSKFIWKRPNQIMGSHTENELRALKFRYSAKHNSWGGTQQMWNQLEGVAEGIRVPAQQILGTKNRAKSAYYPTNVKPKVPKLDTPLTDRELARLSQLAGIDTNK
jgi:hypothetical protein